jgi:predicted nucleic acid-binding Zn ribbon protein
MPRQKPPSSPDPSDSRRAARRTRPADSPARRPVKRPAQSKAGREDAQARRRVLAEWRGIDLAPMEQAASLRVRPLSQLMPHVLKGLGLDQRRANAEILRVWNQSVDPVVTAHAQPTGLRRGTLFVTVDSNVWLSEIVRYRSREILERLQHSFGKDLIARISFRTGG